MEEKNRLNAATAGTALMIAFLMFVNYLTSPHVIWFLYPSLVLLLLTMSLSLWKKKQPKLLSLLSSTIIILFFIINNMLYSPEHPWFLYAMFPVLWWPIVLYSGNYAKTMQFALIGSGITILYYTLLNVFLSPQYPWFIYPAFAVLWWPIGLYFGTNKKFFALSIVGSSLIIIFFIAVNAFSSPETVWAVYPIFSVIWWPLSLYYFSFKKSKVNSIN